MSETPLNPADLRDQAVGLRLHGLLAHWSEVMADADAARRIAQWLRWETDERGRRSLERRLREAHIGQFKPVADFDWSWPKRIDRAAIEELMTLQFMTDATNVVLVGGTGCGKTWLACALAQQAARQGFSVLYTRATRLLQELQVAHGDGSFARRLAQLARLDVLVLDDLAIAPIAAQERQDLLELLDDRVGNRSTLITSQLPSSAWHAWLAEPTIADAIMDRLLHGSHTIALKGESLRRAKPQA